MQFRLLEIMAGLSVPLSGLLLPFSVFAHDIAFHEKEMERILASGNPEECATISESYLITDCLITFADSIDDDSVCSVHPKVSGQQECLAVTEGSISPCLDLQDQDKSVCVTRVAKELKVHTICEQLEGHFRNRCITEVIEVTGMHDACNDLVEPTQSMKDICITNVAVFHRSVDGCETIQSTSMRKGCIRDIAIATIDPDLCNQVGSKDSRHYSACIVRTALAAEDVDMCLHLSKDHKTKCKSEVAAALNIELEDHSKAIPIVITTLVFLSIGILYTWKQSLR